MTPTSGFYVDANGNVCSIATPPNGCQFQFEDKSTYQRVLIVVSHTGEVHDEYVLWPSLDAMSDAGVDVSKFRDHLVERQKT